MPFGRARPPDIAEKFTLAYERRRTIFEQGKALIREMLNMDPKARPSAANCLQDEWLRIYAAQQDMRSQQFLLSLNSLKPFTSEQKLRQAFFTFITSQVKTKELKKQRLSVRLI
jgi:serine/threonine protein kinase